MPYSNKRTRFYNYRTLHYNNYTLCHINYAPFLHKYPITIANHALHCVKSIQMWSFFGLFFVVFGLNTGKYGPEKTPYLYTFHTVLANISSCNNCACLVLCK